MKRNSRGIQALWGQLEAELWHLVSECWALECANAGGTTKPRLISRTHAKRVMASALKAYRKRVRAELRKHGVDPDTVVQVYRTPRRPYPAWIAPEGAEPAKDTPLDDQADRVI